METSASYEARSAPSLYPTGGPKGLKSDAEQAGRAIEVPEKGGTMARRGSSKARFSSGALEENFG